MADDEDEKELLIEAWLLLNVVLSVSLLSSWSASSYRFRLNAFGAAYCVG